MHATESEQAAPTAERGALRVYAIDGALLGLFMVSACSFGALFEHPSSPVRQVIEFGFARRACLGVAMGLTALGLIYSPWGKRSGALMNPAMTLCFLRLGGLEPRHALGYVAGQFVGATLGVASAAWFFRSWLAHPAVNYVVTEPGAHGPLIAWLAEATIGFVMATVVMSVNRVPRLAPRAGFFAAALLALFIAFEAPLSGTSMNPARSFGSALLANSFHGFWIYLSAPVCGMLFGAEMQGWLVARHSRLCGKVNHSEAVACFVRCKCLVPRE